MPGVGGLGARTCDASDKYGGVNVCNGGVCVHIQSSVTCCMRTDPLCGENGCMDGAPVGMRCASICMLNNEAGSWPARGGTHKLHVPTNTEMCRIEGCHVLLHEHAVG
jgi:hypothetical protein